MTLAGVAVTGVPRVDEHVHQRDAQPLGVGCRPWHRGIELELRSRRRAGRLRRRRRFPAQRVEIHRRQLEPYRPREIEHLVDEPVQAHDLFVDVGDGLADGRRGMSGRRSV